MAKDKKPIKVKVKVVTRARAERALSKGADPNLFVKHGNYHVRAKAWKKLGRPLPEEDGVDALLATLQGKPVPKDAEAATTFNQALRAKFLSSAA
jgi:hypothetical protein